MIKLFKKLFSICLVITLIVISISCSNGYAPNMNIEFQQKYEYCIDNGYLFNESYNEVNENNFNICQINPKSYFSMDSFTASYSNLRRYINSGYKLNGDIILTDELINYFDYDFEKPSGDETFKINSELGIAPWNEEHKLLTVAVTTKEAEVESYVGNNYVFLIDVSGSMSSENKLPLIQKSLNLLIEQLDKNDRISIVTYASGVKVVADGMKATNIFLKNRIDSLSASGGTFGSAGLETAYQVAEKHFIKNGNNRIILCTDGDFNIGKVTGDDLSNLISEKRKSGVYLTCLGFGVENYDAVTMESLAKNGNGGYAYIDDEREARKVFINDFTKTMYTVAKDVKTCINFNPEVVEEYRLIGYENKQLTEEEYNDETKDAGEIGSGHTSVVCYELILKENSIDETLAEVEIKYKDPLNDESKITNKQVNNSINNINTDNYKFVSNLVWFSLILRVSPYVVNSNYQNIIDNLENIQSIKGDEFKEELITLVKTAKENNLVADEEYKNVRVLVIYSMWDIQYIIVKKNTVITKDYLISLLNINPDKASFVDFYLDSDLTNKITNLILNENTNIYFIINEKTQ